MQFKSLFNTLFTKHLMLTNCVGVCGSLAIGDFCEQRIAARVRGNKDPTDMTKISKNL